MAPTANPANSSTTARQRTEDKDRDKQISELKDRIKDLCVSSKQTNDRVDQLTRSLSSSLAVREREVSVTQELRDAIRQLSHSVSMSTSELRGKQGSQNNKSVILEENSKNHAPNSRQEDNNEDVDEFMQMVEPAIVEDSWSMYDKNTVSTTTDNNNNTDISKTPQSHTSVKASSSGIDEVKDKQPQVNEQVDTINNNPVTALDKEETNTVAGADIAEEGGAGNNELESEGGDTEIKRNDNQLYNLTNVNGAHITPIQTAKQLFESEAMAETRQLFNSSRLHTDGDDMVNRRLSMPTLDGPLSDIES